MARRIKNRGGDLCSAAVASAYHGHYPSRIAHRVCVTVCVYYRNIRSNVVKYIVSCEHKYSMIYMSMCKNSKNN